MLHNFVLDQGEEGWSSSFRRLTGNQVRGADMKCVGYFISGCIEHLEQAEISKQSNAVKLLLAASLGLTQLSTKLVIFVQTSLIAKDIVVLVTSSLMRCLCKLSDADENMTPEAECVELRKLGSLLSDLLFVVLSVLKNFVTKRDEKMHGIMMDCYNRINSGQADINEHVQSVVLLLCTDEIPVEQGCFLIFIIDLLNLQIHSETRFPVPYKKILCNMEILLFLVTFASEKLPEGKPAGAACLQSRFRIWKQEMQTKYPDVIPRCISSAAALLHGKTDASQEPPVANGRWKEEVGGKDSQKEGISLDLSSKEAAFYLSLLPSLPNLIVVLLKFLLASSVNTKEVEDESVEISSPPVHDMASDIAFDSADLWDEIIDAMELEPQDFDPHLLSYGQILQNSGETVVALFNAEWTRYRRIVGKCTATCLRKTMHFFHRFHHLAKEYICLLLNDSNFLLLSLKMLNQDVEKLISLPPPVLQLDKSILGLLDGKSRSLRRKAICMHKMFSREEIDMSSEMKSSVCVRSIANISCLLDILHQTIMGSRSRIRTLVSFKAPLVLRKVLEIKNEQVELLVLLLYKEIACMLGRKWKSANCHILSLIYKRIVPDLNGDYLSPDMASQQDVEQEDDMNRKNVGRFNAFVMNSAHGER